MKILFPGLLLLITIHLNAQKVVLQEAKPVVDTSIFGKWPKILDGGSMSGDGSYVFYYVGNLTPGSRTLIIQSVDGTWKKEFSGVTNAQITANSKILFFKLADKLFMLHLGSENIESISGVRGFELFTSDKQEYLAYQTNGKKLIVKDLDLEGKQEEEYSGVLSYYFNASKTVLVICRSTPDPSNPGSNSIEWINLNDKSRKTLWQSTKEICRDIIFDKSGLQLAFSTVDTGTSASGTSFWYYRSNMTSPVICADNRSRGLSSNEKIAGVRLFSTDGRWLFLSISKDQEQRKEPDPSATKVDIWSYRDTLLQVKQLAYLDNPDINDYLAAISIERISIDSIQALSRVSRDGDLMLSNISDLSGDYILTMHIRGDRDGIYGSSWWDSLAMPSIQLVSLKDGSRTIIKDYSAEYERPVYNVSPGGKFIVYFDNLGGKKATLQWYTYEISTGIRRCITKNIIYPFNVEMSEYDMPSTHYSPYGYEVAGWIGQDEKVLLYDSYDVWEVDLRNKSSANNLTEGYGRKHHIRFVPDTKRAVWQVGDSVLFKAFNKMTKESGYFIKQIGKYRLHKIILGPFLYESLQKGTNTNSWLVRRQNASEPGNLFVLKETGDVVQISHIEPQKKYNWLTSELVSWKAIDGKPGLGILYKPENFDSTRKYPIIFTYYEQKSDQLNHFIYPNFTASEIDIPFFVSQGYLIFVTDIHYTIGDPGQSACNYILSAAQNLLKRVYIDGKHMGLQGHSFGGYQTQFVITHSKIFAAAMSSSGWPDFISRYGAILVGIYSGQFTTEVNRSRIGSTLWERPELYIRNSPIFYANHITTPLLMMNNKKDDQVPFAQGVEFFTALRRLRKKVWMLQYDDGEHWLNNKDAIDLTIRMNQFFDYYLKNMPAPKWMVEGISAKMKGIDKGYELERGKTP